ncbi:MAG: hypothetical protein EA398_13775 [Deltaproteobacteria bacterium]|nr:MAG: hypothetical protein EA398_13775 [Deltaproteobacteria bacterium]
MASAPCALKGVDGPTHLVALLDLDRHRLHSSELHRWPLHPAMVEDDIEEALEFHGNGRPLNTLRCARPELVQALRPWAKERQVRLVLDEGSEMAQVVKEVAEQIAEEGDPPRQGPGVPPGHEALWYQLAEEVDEVIREVDMLQDDLVVTEGPPALAERVVGVCLHEDGFSQVLIFRDEETLTRLTEEVDALDGGHVAAADGAAEPELPDTLQLIPGAALTRLEWADAIARGCPVHGTVPVLLRERERGVFETVVDADAHLTSLAALQILAAVLADLDAVARGGVGFPVETVLGPVTVAWSRDLEAAQTEGGG